MNRPIILDTIAGQAADIRRQHAASEHAFAGERGAAVAFLQQLITAVTPAYPALESRVAPQLPDAMPELRGVVVYGSEEPVLVGFDSPLRSSGEVGGSCMVWVHNEVGAESADLLIGVTFGGRWVRDGGRTNVTVNATVRQMATGTEAIGEELARKAVQVTQRVSELVSRVHEGNSGRRALQAETLMLRLRDAAAVLRGESIA